MNRRLIAVLALSLVTLVGCGSTPAPDRAPAAPAPSTATQPAPAAEVAPKPADGVVPTALSIPSIGAQSTLIPVGLELDGSLAIPSVHTPKQAAWFEPGPEPGQNGPSVIVGHIDGDHIQGVFFKLKDIRDGDTVEVSFKDSPTLRFAVYKKELISKDAFPADRVFGYTATPELRLITCGGDFDPAAHSYKGNTIAYARLVQ